MDATLPWPATTPPRLKVAGQFPLADRAHPTTYLGATHALHLHGYAGRMRLGGTDLALQPGDVTFTPAGMPSSYDLPAAGRHWCVHFHPAAASGPAIALPLHLPLGPAAAFASERLAAISRLHARAPDLLAEASAAVAFQDLLLWCAARARKADVSADEVAERVGAILDARFAEPLNADRLAREVGHSQSYVARAFRQRFGMTAPRYALLRRMAHARLLLETTNLPVGEVAARIGVDDPHYFNKLVRRFLGASPSEVRRQAAADRGRPTHG
ncbi:MAG: helix-turn-helix transcriptional regulator [Caulobacterales bacterium]|nr:helix-turn-helix transcriptional regulator [Caulobacterales bacterium]